VSEPSEWSRITTEDPTQSARYIERFRTMAAAGADLAGEARLIDAMAPRGARILDAGCGPGRVGAALAEVGHVVVGVDADAELIAAAEQDHPGPRWLIGDLAELDLAAQGHEPFDVIVCAGNVMAFLAPSTRLAVLANFGSHLAPGGRAVVGFGSGRGYEFGDFVLDVDNVGLALDATFETWDLRPFTDRSEFLVAVLSTRQPPSK
jgi:SAM-dependent methyltransferase